MVDRRKLRAYNESVGAFLAVGVSMGVIFGLVFDSLGVGIALGAAGGIVLGGGFGWISARHGAGPAATETSPAPEA